MLYALGIPDKQAEMTNWKVYNSSVTRKIYGCGKISFAAFSSVAPMEQDKLRHLITLK